MKLNLLILSTALLLALDGFGQCANNAANRADNNFFNCRRTAVSYGLRTLTCNYDGPLVQVRKASTGVTQKIYAVPAATNNSGMLDTTALRDFCNGSTCYVTDWYDQSGCQNNATQPVSTSQPIIFQNGKTVTVNGRPSLYFNYADSENAPAVFLTTGPFNVSRWKTSAANEMRTNYSLIAVAQLEGNDYPAASPMPTALVSKAKVTGSVVTPYPFVVQNDRFKATNKQNVAYNTGLEYGIDQLQGLNVWAFCSASKWLRNNVPQGYQDSIETVAYVNGFLNGYGQAQGRSTNDQRVKPPLVIGANSMALKSGRSQVRSSLACAKGYISEILLFTSDFGDFHGGAEPQHLNETLRLQTASLLHYYRIHYPPTAQSPLTLDQMGLSVAESANLKVAYSTRRLSTGYDGPALRIEKTVNGAVVSGLVSFDSEGEVSVESTVTYSRGGQEVIDTLSDFCSGTNCYVSTWYNQALPYSAEGSNSKYHANQTVRNLQPILVNNGRLNLINAKSAIRFNGTSAAKKFLTTGRFTAFDAIGSFNQPTGSKGFDVYVTAQVDSTNTQATFINKGSTSPPTLQIANESFQIGGQGAVPFTLNFSQDLNQALRVNLWQFSATPVRLTAPVKTLSANLNNKSNNGESEGTQQIDINDTGDPFYIGTDQSDAQSFLNGSINEILVFSSAPNFGGNRQNLIFDNVDGEYLIAPENSLSFEQDDSNFVTIGDETGMYAAGSSYTKEGWIYAYSFGDNEHLISSNDIFGLNRQGKLRVENDRGSNTNSGNAIANRALETRKWTHVAVTWDGTSYALYINGLPVKATSGKGSPRASTASQTYLGKDPQSDSRYFDGMMDEVRIWNVAKSAREISDNFDKSITKATGLVAYYSFNQGNPGGNNAGLTTLLNQAEVRNKAINNGVLNGFTLSGLVSNWVKCTIPFNR